MSVMILKLALLTLCASVPIMAGTAPAAETGTAEEPSTMALGPADKDAISPSYPLTPEMSDQIAYEQAIAAGSNAALIMFLARNPDTLQAPEVRQLLAARPTPDDRATTESVAGGDADVVGAFDAARLAGTRAGWEAFLQRHGGHALSAQVEYFMP